MISSRREVARLQSNFYRDQYHRMLRWLIAAIIIMFVLIAAITYFILFQPPAHYYADTVDGKILPMPAHWVLKK